MTDLGELRRLSGCNVGERAGAAMIDAADEIERLRAELSAANARVAELKTALIASADADDSSADQFAFYAVGHRAKKPPDEEKARTNLHHMNRCVMASVTAHAAGEG